MRLSEEERAERYRRLAEAAAAQGRHRHARNFRRLARDLRPAR